MEQYYYQVGEKVLGPHTPDQLAILKRSGVITGKTLVCKAGEERWIYASAVLLASPGTLSPSSNPQRTPGQETATPLKAWKPPVASAPTVSAPTPVIICYLIASLSAVFGIIMLVAMARADALSVVVYQIAATVCISDALVFWLIGCGIKYAFEASAVSRANSVMLNQICKQLKEND